MSTVRLKDKHNRLLDKLYGYYRQRGIPVTKQDIVGNLIEDAVKKEGLIGDEQENSLDSLDQFFSLLDSAPDWGVTDTSTTVDDYLYGSEQQEKKDT
ncbi:MAG: hypothetical protein ACXAEU_07005 [Candidatus Hodarchaeales archaeon]|jgi:hypothetical protein